MQAPVNISRANAEYVEQLYEQYRQDPQSVDAQWQAYFAGFDLASGEPAVKSAAPPRPVSGTGLTPAAAPSQMARAAPVERIHGPAAAGPAGAYPLSIEIADLVHSYRELGHFIADLDPLGHRRPRHPLLELSNFGLSEADLDRSVGRGNFLHETDGTLGDLLNKLHSTYCGTLGVEYLEISDKSQRDWLQQRMEPILNHPQVGADEAKQVLRQLTAAQGFEEFLHTRFIGQKRFSLQGAESLVPLLNFVVEEGAALGVDEFVMGMAHRGRLNVLAHVLGKPYEVMLAEFAGTLLPQGHHGDGDVKYHLGYSQDRNTRCGRRVHLGLSFNPSHLELVNPVVEGIVRAKQYYLADTERSRVVPILMHGDAAFTGQGIVAETLALSEMPYWRTGGTIHIIINNQIGFTTMPKQGRFTPYPTDIAKSIQAPIFHVNGDDPEAVVHAAKTAITFRQRFHCDVIIDLWCYRRYGHNEGDEPSFTQPVMYRQIEAHPTVRDIYAKQLTTGGVMDENEVEQLKKELEHRLESGMSMAKDARPQVQMAPFSGVWKGLERPGNDFSADTTVPADTLRRISEAATRVPPQFTVHPKLVKMLQNRQEMGRGKLPLDYATAEMLAMGSMLVENIPIRFVGQDVQRGTFSHRHACLHDYNNGAKYYPLANLSEYQAPFIIVNTMLSELAVLGFEYGFSSADPRNLVIWEAQFGDFVNGAQPIIDQFLAAGESKWQKYCGMVILLPHGYEGQGPEHSNGYVERFLALCAENNLQVCQPTLPAQYFHLLRRQMVRKFRKPLICYMPKSLLRAEYAVSQLTDLTDKTFQPVLDDPALPQRERVRRLLLCSGKVFFALDAARQKRQLEHVAIVRVEQFYPLPQKELQTILARYRHAQDVCWVQDEPKNRGGWTFMSARLRPLLADNTLLSYIGRQEAASPATGVFRLHQIEEQQILSQALDLPAEAPPPAVQNVQTAAQQTAEATPVSD